MSEISSCYNPQETEDKWYSFWEQKGYFHATANPAKKPFSVVIPPPNVTGILHMGHALNNTIQDILVRYHHMIGEEALWMPGTDHAGIATQNVVEKAIAKEGLKRQDLGREKFIERVWQWKEQYGSTIIRQLKKIGASCDWQRLRFTMDAEYSRSVTDVFVRLYEKGLIYRGTYIINWCPRCQTALSDEEAPHKEINGNLYYIKYPIKDRGQGTGGRGQARGEGRGTTGDGYIVVATTRPETMLGDTAVAVNPKDKRYKKLIGETLILPLVNREIKVIGDSSVDMKFGTGALKVTPAHDPNDYALGKKHGLESINVMHPDARMNEFAAGYKDLDRFKARELILQHLQEKNLLEKVEPHQLSAGHCYRCQTLIEPYLSKQWFVKMKPLAAPAIEAVRKGKIKFYPVRWTKVYLNWMENIQDWCISRQIWWGHRIPVYYCENCETGKSEILNPKSETNSKFKIQNSSESANFIVSCIKPDKCPVCASVNIRQDEDVLDTWFSSWLWPFATFYWPFESKNGQGMDDGRRMTDENSSPHPSSLRADDLKYFYPTSALVTAPEIIFFWVARMIMAGLEFMGDIPFKDVYIHGTVRDIEGKKMSKSLGNIIDPLDIIKEYGTDALRFSLISITAQGQDVFLAKERFEQGRNFANKIWNASRFVMSHLSDAQVNVDLCQLFKKEDLDIAERWILSRFYSVVKELDKYLAGFKFNEAANLLYGFFWHEYCDWYLEMIKPKLQNNQPSVGLANTKVVMFKVLEKYLRLLHPFMPFISEEIWQRLPHQGESILSSGQPHLQEKLIDRKVEKQVALLFNVIVTIRTLRSSLELKPDQKAKVSIYSHIKQKEGLILQNSGLVRYLARVEDLDFLSVPERPAATISEVVEDVDIYLHFSGLLDVAKEKEKINRKLKELQSALGIKEARLKSPDFIQRAPEQVVAKERAGVEQIVSTLKRLEKMYRQLG